MMDMIDYCMLRPISLNIHHYQQQIKGEEGKGKGKLLHRLCSQNNSTHHHHNNMIHTPPSMHSKCTNHEAATLEASHHIQHLIERLSRR